MEVGFGGDAAEGSPAFPVEEAFEDRASFLGLAVVEIPIADTVLHGVVGREIPASQLQQTRVRTVSAFFMIFCLVEKRSR